MNLTFRLRFATHTGQSLWFTGDVPLPRQQPLDFLDRESWQVKIPLTTPEAGQPLNYSYRLRQPDGSQITDWGRDRILTPADYPAEELLVIDSWNVAGFFENAFYTDPFKKVLLADRFTKVPTAPAPQATHTFRVKAPLLEKNQTVCLLGEGRLGHWQTTSPLLLARRPEDDYFSLPLDLRGQSFPFAYKYGVFDLAKKAFVRFEDGVNRVLADVIAPRKHTVVNDGFVILPADTWHGAGVAVPVFSLRSEQSFGIGEFTDLKPLADWGKKIGLKLIQVLPVNDSTATHTWRDSYPYAAISAFALHPQYLNLAAIVVGDENQKLLASLEPERQRLNALGTIDHEAVMKAKLEFLKKIFPAQKTATFKRPEYRQFFSENAAWLEPYAAFCVLRDRFKTADFNQWPEHKTYSADKIAAFARDNAEVTFHYFIQFHLHLQLQEAAAHAHANGLVMKGDIAIGVYRHSADVWQSPELFHLDQQAGAPPDAFAAKGQNWGFPTYNWPRMAADGLAWWKQRLAQMGRYFDAFRIDHILGFFRIWSSPAHAVEGILGHFVPALPLAPEEFTAQGIPFERERFLQPFINDVVLQEIFGNDADFIRAEFLDPKDNGYYSLKPAFATQREVEAYIGAHPSDKRDQNKIKIGLFDLISNVILLEAEGELHFRFKMEDTASFQALPPGVREKLRALYLDYLFRRQDDFWRRQAMEKLPALKRVTNMLICGEDLGFVPACVPDVMRDLGFLSLEIQRMPKKQGLEFAHLAEAPYLSVVTPATHDMSTIRGWWVEDHALIQKFFNRELGFPGDAPFTATPKVVEAVIHQHLASSAMWSIFQLQDLLGLDENLRRVDIEAERINVPAIPDFYWRYRMHLTLEQLAEAEAFNARLAEMVRVTGRSI